MFTLAGMAVQLRRNTQQIHVAEKVASDNLVQASGKGDNESRSGTGEDTRRSTAAYHRTHPHSGRTRGAGAERFNRDIGNIEHRISDANTKISFTPGELKRRISTIAVQWQAK